MKTVTVRKNKTHRAGIRFLAAAGWFAMGGLLYCIKDPVISAALCLPAAAVLLPLVLYFETWTMTFREAGIEKSLFGRRTGRYSYHQIREVRAARSRTDQRYIRITFQDGRAYQFRMDDENAAMAVRMIQSHHSISA